MKTAPKLKPLDELRQQADELEARIRTLTKRKSLVIQSIAAAEVRVKEQEQTKARLRALIGKANAVELRKPYPQDRNGVLNGKKGTVCQVRTKDALVEWQSAGAWSIEFEFLRPVESLLPETGFISWMQSRPA